jgi:hypothetical protein
MRGRPTLIKNLVPGMVCRIRVEFGTSADGWCAIDESKQLIWLAGRTAGLGKLNTGFKVSLIGHLKKDSNDHAFVVEEIEGHVPDRSVVRETKKEVEEENRQSYRREWTLSGRGYRGILPEYL